MPSLHLEFIVCSLEAHFLTGTVSSSQQSGQNKRRVNYCLEESKRSSSKGVLQ